VLVLAIPVPQVELLLKTSGLLPEKSRSGTGAGVSVSDRLAWVSDTLYHPCLTGVFVLEPAVGALGGLPPALPPLLRDPTPELSGIFDQRKKGLVGGSGGSAEVLVVQAAPGWSTENFGFSESEVLPALWELACGVLARDYGMSERPRLRQSLLHRWRYCEPVRALPHEFGEVFPSQDAADFPPLLVCGDAFGPPRMETAYVSGRAAGRAAGQAAGKAVGHAGSLIG
jgi:predicted NAD/FAD-dependent oxidoreductase